MFRKLLKSAASLHSKTLYKSFCTANPTNNPTLILNKHFKSVKQLQYDSFRMKPPQSRIAKIEGKRLRDLGFLRPFGEFAKSIDIYSIEEVPKIEGANTPSASWIGINFPIKEDPFIKNIFKKFYTDGIRVGKLMEIFDLIGGASAYRYLNLDILSRDATIVTLCVDNFHLFEEVISTDRDIFISSYVSYAGSSSLEVQVDVTYTDDPHVIIASASYLFVARDAIDYSKPKKVPKLVFEGEDDPDGCILRYEYGKLNQKARKESAARSTFKVAPSSEESEHLHSLFKHTLDPKFACDYVPIPNTSVEKTLLMHLQDKNIHNKVFGGFLMKEAADLAWTTSYLHGGGSYPDFVHIDDILFLNPVEIGSVSIFKSWITYVEDNLSHVMITVDTLKNRLEKHRTCEFHMTLSHPNPIPKVMPISYFDGMTYIEGQRRVHDVKRF